MDTRTASDARSGDRLGWVLGLTSTAYFMVVLDSLVVVSALPPVAGVGISMALPTVPAAVLDAVAPEQMGKASGVNVMAQRFGAVFAIAIGSAIFSANGHLGSPAGFTAGFRPALWACVGFAALASISCFALTARAPEGAGSPEAVDVLVDV